MPESELIYTICTAVFLQLPPSCHTLTFNMKSSKKSQRVVGSEIMCMPLLDNVKRYLKSYFIILVFSMHCLSHRLGEYMADAQSHKLLCPRNQKYSMFKNISTNIYIHTHSQRSYTGVHVHWEGKTFG